MKILSFDTNSSFKIKRDTKQNNLFNLFQKNIIYINTIPLYPYIVPREFEMRLDRISNYLYGSPNYVEELMILNDIINPYSIKIGQTIFYCKAEDMPSFYTKDKILEEENKQKIINKQSTNQKISNSTSKLEQIKVDKDNRIQIIDSFI